MTTRTQSSINGVIKDLVGLSDTDIEHLRQDGISSSEDLSFIQFMDLNAEINVVKRRKLDMIRQYLEVPDYKITATTTMHEIKRCINDFKPVNGSRVEGKGVDIDRGAPKIYTDHLKEFSGDPIDYEEWEGASAATLKQTIYKEYLSRPPVVGNDYEKARNAELYNMILSAVRKGHAFNIVDKVSEDVATGECGFSAWKALKTWYMDPSVKRIMADHYTNKLDILTLDNDTTATEFINSFDSYVRKIEKFEGQVWNEDKKIREFKKRIVSEDYDTEKRTFDGSTLEQFVSKLRKREQDLDLEAISSDKVQRRFKKNDANTKDDESRDQGGKTKGANGNHKAGDTSSNKTKVPFIPNFLFKSMDAITQKNIKKWREMVNTGKSMAPSDLVKAERTSTSSSKRDHEEDPDSQSEKKEKSKKGKKQRRLTNVAASGLKDDTVEVKLDSEDEQYSASNCLTREVGVSFPRYDSMIQVKPGPSIQDSEEVTFMMKVRRFKSLGISKGRTCKPTYAVIDSGADQDHVGNGW